MIDRHRITICTLACLAALLDSGCARMRDVSTASPQARFVEIDIPNARVPLDGVLTGGQPTLEHLEQAAEAGYRTVINLRPEDEPGLEGEAAVVSGLGMRYVHIPVAGADGLTPDNTRRLAGELADPEALPAMVHCASGNRVGALLALEAAWLDGASLEQAIELGRNAGLTRLEPAVRKILGQTGNPPSR